MTVSAAHVSAPKATPAHHAHGAQHDAAHSGGDTLFADLLAKTSDADDADAKADKSAADLQKTHGAHSGKSKKSKDDTAATDDASSKAADVQSLSAHIAALNAKFASANGHIAKTKADKADSGDADPVDAADADAAKKTGHDDTSILNRIMDAKADAAAKNDPAKDATQKVLNKGDADAASVKGANAAEQAKADAHAAHADRSDRAARAADAAAQAESIPQDKAAAAEKAKDAKAADAKTDAARDASAQATTADKAAVLAAAADKSIRQSAVSQGTQARALPAQVGAQMAADKPGDDGKGGDSGKSGDDAKAAINAKTVEQSQHAKSNTDTRAHEDVIQPAATQAPVNTSNAAQTASQAAQDQAANVQPVTGQTQTQTQPTVTASLQVAPQTAAQAHAVPDFTSLAVQIAAKSEEGTKHFDIRLDPPELGRVDVRLSIDDAGRAQAHLTVEKPQTLDLMQHDRSSLERALRDSGVDLSQNGLNFSLKGQEKQGDNSAPFRGRSRNLAVTAAIEATSAAVAASTNSFASGNTRLDIRV